MTSALEDRDNASDWAALLDTALPALDAVFPRSKTLVPGAKPDWTLGGGTAIALRIAHRISDDIDLFVAASVKQFSPAVNPAAKAISPRFQYPGHYVKFELEKGEIDFLSPPLLTEPGYSAERFRDRTIALETLEEVIVKKVRYRSAQFKPRDIFDLAAVERRKPDIALVLAEECGDVLPQLAAIIEQRRKARLDLQTFIRPTPAFHDLVGTCMDKGLQIVRQAIDLAFIKDALEEAPVIKPSDKPGRITFKCADEGIEQDFIRRYDLHPELAKTLLERQLKKRSPEHYQRYLALRSQRNGPGIGD